MSGEAAPAIVNPRITSVVTKYVEGDYHGGEMLLKSAVTRFAKDKKYAEVEQLITEVLRVFSSKSVEVITEVGNAIINLHETLVQNCIDSKREYQADWIDSFLKLLEPIPYSTNKVKTLQKANKTFFQGQNQKLVTFISKDALKSSNYAVCQTFSLVSSDPNVPIQLLDVWSQEGNPGEKAWYVVRYVLFKLVLPQFSTH